MKKILSVLTIVLAVTVANSTYAFDLKTHAVIGNEVLADAQDGSVSIAPFGEFAVAPWVLESLNRYPDMYLLGTLGPDVLPDFVAGQVTAHAAPEGGWNSDDWIKYVIGYESSSASISVASNALSYGYLSHAAADVFAHTYVNTYAGDAFEFGDEDKGVVELRHFLLERYIANYLPYEVDVDSIFGGGVTYESFEKTGPSPHEHELAQGRYMIDFFLLQVGHGTLPSDISDPSSDYNRSLEFLGTLVPSQDAIASLQEYLRWQLSNNIIHRFRIFNPSPYTYGYYMEYLEDNPVYVEWEPGVETRPVRTSSSWESRVTEALTDKFIRDDKVASEYQNVGTASYLYHMDKIEEDFNENARTLNIIRDWIKRELTSELERKAYLDLLVQRYSENGTEVFYPMEIRAVDSQDIPICNGSEAGGIQCIHMDDLDICDTRHPEHYGTKEYLSELYQNWLLGNCPGMVISQIESEIIGATAEEIYNLYPELEQIANDLGLGRLSYDEAQEMLILVAGLIIFYETFDIESLVVDLALKKYLAHSVTAANEAYLAANIETAKRIMEGASLEDTAEPLSDWLLCHAPIYTGKIYGSNEVCKIADAGVVALQEFLESMEGVARHLAEQTGLTDEALSIVNAYQEFEQSVNNVVREHGEKIVEQVLSEEQMDFILLLSRNISDETLNAAFLNKGYNSSLLAIPDMASRVKAEMYLDTSGNLDVEKFSPIFNAVQLTKLSLLSQSEFDRLLGMGGVSLNYSDFIDAGRFNVLFSWVGSLDGNHQWMSESPEYFRDDNNISIERYFYSLDDGFDIWNQNEARENVFKKIFKGPLSKGIEYPEMIGEAPVLGTDIDTRVCEGDPFPVGVTKTKCLNLPAVLIPIITLLN